MYITNLVKKILLSQPTFLFSASRLWQRRKFLDFKLRSDRHVKVVLGRDALHDAVAGACEVAKVHYFEFGVYSGKSFLPWLSRNKGSCSRFFGFDTFTGLPEKWDRNREKGAFDVNSSLPEVGGDSRVEFVRGKFQDSLHPFLRGYRRSPSCKLIVHVDCDIFSGAIYVLFAMEPLLESDDIVIFDEFKDHNNEFRAFEIFTDACGIELVPFLRTKNENQWAFRVKRRV